MYSCIFVILMYIISPEIDCNRLNIITNKNKNLLPTIRNCIYNIYIKLGMHCIFGKSGIIRYFLLSG